MRIPKTKIVATIGPASSNESTLRKMFEKGLDMVRLNFSHGTHASHIRVAQMIRDLNKKRRRAIKIMQDLEGYRIRVGKLAEPVELKKNRAVYFTQDEIEGNAKEVSFDYFGSLKKIPKGSLVYVDDGRVQLVVEAVEKKKLKLKVTVPGVLKENKGVNIPGVSLDFEALTPKDKNDAKICVKEKFDAVAQSFVRNAKDLKLLKKIILPENPKCRIFAKIENREALRNLGKIVDEADGVIVARGDLGICVPIYKVPMIQKEIIRTCGKKGKPVIVATQMLDSMTEHDLPTRAEVSDVANAILDGATHLLLSGETAVGRHPAKVIDMMNKIIKYTEAAGRAGKR